MIFTHVVLTITEWVGVYGTRYLSTLYTDDGVHTDFRKLDIDEARILQWELVKQGAEKTASYNPHRPHIYTREIHLMRW